MKTILPLIATAALTGCAGIVAPSGGAMAQAALGQRVQVGASYLTPVAVLEDSRCPASVQCVWAGQVRLLVKIGVGPKSENREITTVQPIELADGKVALTRVRPARKTPGAVPVQAYRFGFTFEREP